MGHTNVLGISCYYHDSAACLVQGGEVVAAAQEERFSRLKHDASFPAGAIEYCLSYAGLQPNDLDVIVFYEKPMLRLERLLLTQLREWPLSVGQFVTSQQTWFTKLRIASTIRKLLGYRGAVRYCRHHESHAASALYTSPFERATVVTVDGVGEWTTASIFAGDGANLRPLREIRFPHSLGLFYSAFTAYLGFAVNCDEYKVMGLAPYGEPAYAEALRREVLRLHDDGSFSLNMRYFKYQYGSRMVHNRRVASLLGVAPRQPDEPLTQEHRDLAMSVQALLEEGMLALCKNAVELTGDRRLCLAGGVALNCTANGKLHRSPWVDDLHVFPAAGDAGGAVGAALFWYHQLSGQPRNGQSFPTPFLGPAFEQSEIDAYLARAQIPFDRYEPADLVEHVAGLLADQAIVGWFQGRMELGPRALGNRSILADPTRPDNWPRINQKVKFREDFRPLAPAVLEDRAVEYFDVVGPSPYMLLTVLHKTDRLAAVTHVDGSARLQTVSRQQNARFYDLIAAFGRRTGTPVLINTSFNTAGMPVVCTPQNAFQCFAESDLDALVLGNAVIDRRSMPFMVRGQR